MAGLVAAAVLVFTSVYQVQWFSMHLMASFSIPQMPWLPS